MGPGEKSRPADVATKLAVPDVGARWGHRVHDDSARLTELRREARGRDLELAHQRGEIGISRSPARSALRIRIAVDLKTIAHLSAVGVQARLKDLFRVVAGNAGREELPVEGFAERSAARLLRLT